MADVTIDQLPNLSPSSNTYVPISDGITTGRALTNNLGVPIGFIGMWSGSIASIPSGWALCNGTTVNGRVTPDLRNKFIIGAAVDNTGVANTNITGSNTQTGGTKDAIVVNHTHTITDPGHVHAINATSGGITNSGISKYAGGGSSSADYNSKSATTGITINNQGSDGTNQNLPPYYALAYIMKVS